LPLGVGLEFSSLFFNFGVLRQVNFGLLKFFGIPKEGQASIFTLPYFNIKCAFGVFI